MEEGRRRRRRIRRKKDSTLLLRKKDSTLLLRKKERLEKLKEDLLEETKDRERHTTLYVSSLFNRAEALTKYLQTNNDHLQRLPNNDLSSQWTDFATMCGDLDL